VQLKNGITLLKRVRIYTKIDKKNKVETQGWYSQNHFKNLRDHYGSFTLATFVSVTVSDRDTRQPLDCYGSNATVLALATLGSMT